MKKSPLSKCGARLAPMFALLAAGTFSALATPYATCLTNNAGIISFRLNQTNAEVHVIYNGGASVTNLGPLPAGLTVTNLGITGNFKVKVAGSAPAGYVQISADTDYKYLFANPRGLSINKNHGSPNFGRVYVSANNGVAGGVRTTTKGIYILNADGSDPLGQGDTARLGGLQVVPFGDAASPEKITVGQDDMIYMCDRTDANGGLFVTDADVSTNSVATNALFGIGGPAILTTNFHGSLEAVWVEGSQTAGNLKIYTIDEDYQPDGSQKHSLWRFDVGNLPFPYSTNDNSTPVTLLQTPILNAGNAAFNDIVRGGVSNYFYRMQVAASGFQPGIYVLDAAGVEITNSLSWTTNASGNTAATDICKTSQALDISWDGKKLINLRGLVSSVAQPAKLITIAPDGTIDLSITNDLVLAPSGQQNTAQRDVAFDPAGNIYAVNSTGNLLRIFARGGNSIATTGSDGTFSIDEPTTITAVNLIGGGTQVQIDFTGPIDAGAYYYKLQSSGTINGTYTDTADTVTRLSSGVFRVVTSVSPGANQFFKIHQP